jgi:hypothetical protein
VQKQVAFKNIMWTVVNRPKIVDAELEIRHVFADTFLFDEIWEHDFQIYIIELSGLTPSARTVYKYSLGLSEAEQKKPQSVLQALREYYGASIGVSGERQKFLRLLQQDAESISSWESRIRNQSAQCEYESFEDELMRDQFISGLTSEQLRVKLIGKGHRHKDGERAKVTLREVVEVAKTFEATTGFQQNEPRRIRNNIPPRRNLTIINSIIYGNNRGTSYGAASFLMVLPAAY